MVDAQAVLYLKEDLPEDDPEIVEAEAERRDSAARVREALNQMTLVSLMQVLGAASEVNSAARDDASDPIAVVQPLLIKFLFECSRDLIGEAMWPHDLAKVKALGRVGPQLG